MRVQFSLVTPWLYGVQVCAYGPVKAKVRDRYPLESLMKYKVLLVEDDLDIRTVFGQILDELGYPYTSAANGFDALEKFDNHPIVMTDWNMPDMSGRELSERIRDDHPETYILMITVRNTPDEVAEAVMAGANDYLAKPIDINDLEKHLDMAVATIEINKAMGNM